jgi:hypothetical protein
MNVFAFAVHCVIPTGGLSTDLWAVVLLDSERITRHSSIALWKRLSDEPHPSFVQVADHSPEARERLL